MLDFFAAINSRAAVDAVGSVASRQVEIRIVLYIWKHRLLAAVKSDYYMRIEMIGTKRIRYSRSC